MLDFIFTLPHQFNQIEVGLIDPLPFIISDVLQAHYDGIHSPADPVSQGEWTTFNNTLERGYNEMLTKSKELVKLVTGKEIDGAEDILKELENALKLESFYYDRKQSLENLAPTLKTSTEFKANKDSEGEGFDDNYVFSNLLEIIPKSLDETKTFNKWCEKFEDEGSRPALDFWMAWVESVSDPLGGFVTGESNAIKNTDERRKDFTPALSPKDLELVYKKLEKDLETLELDTTTIADNKSEDKHVNALQSLGEGLTPLYNMLREKLSHADDRRGFLDKVKSIIKGYKSSLKNYNQIRKTFSTKS